ncbi:threonine dehydrogenase [hydrocarbon metagenome]|uniref:Threonine dehydrogenase n=1 Tax=hydrocarbon metagenome TaxID=938273 RepID=A0A0W8FPB5_9ZZZZ
MMRRSLFLVSPRHVEIREEQLPAPAAGQVLVQTIASSISAGTEMLIYRGHVTDETDIAENNLSVKNPFQYPFKYGYSCIGQVVSLGVGVPAEWAGKRVFSFHSHESHFLAGLEELIPLSDSMPIERSLFIPNMETAVNFLLDSQPVIGEQVAVFGMGVVGLLTISLLAQFPLQMLAGIDRLERRRTLALEAGAHRVFPPEDITSELSKSILHSLEKGESGFDLVFELSGSPHVLNQAIAITGFAGRVMIGSWYGEKTAKLELGGRFHRSRIRLLSSQVSTLTPGLAGRWNKSRRMAVALQQLSIIKPEKWITQRMKFNDLQAAYSLLDKSPEEALQVVLFY